MVMIDDAAAHRLVDHQHLEMPERFASAWIGLGPAVETGLVELGSIDPIKPDVALRSTQ